MCDKLAVLDLDTLHISYLPLPVFFYNVLSFYALLPYLIIIFLKVNELANQDNFEHFDKNWWLYTYVNI